MSISEHVYQQIFDHSPIAKLITLADAPSYTIVDVNQAYLDATGRKKEEILGQPVFLAFPESPTADGIENVKRSISSFDTALQTKMPHKLETYRYDIPIAGTEAFAERYWTAVNTPILDEQGEVKYLIHAPTDVTAHYHLQQREKIGIDALKNQRKQLYSIFMQAPVGIGIFRGANYIVELINPSLAEIYGKPIGQLFNKPIFDVLIHAKARGFEEKLDTVRSTGVSYLGKGIEIPLIRHGILEKVYVDFTYVPFYEEDGTIDGVICIATEVTAQVQAMHDLEEAEERARLAADAVAMGTYDLNLMSGEMVTSQRFADIFGFEAPVIRQKYADVIHPDDRNIRKLAHEEAINNGIMAYEARVILQDHSLRWIKVEGKVLYDKERNPIRMLGTVLDITDEKQNIALQKKLITLVDHSVDLMSILDLDGLSTYLNTAGLKLLGFASLKEALKVELSEIYPEEDLAFIRDVAIPAVMENGDWAGNIHVRNHRSQEIIPVFNHYIRIDDHNTSEPIGIGVVMRDLRPELKAKQDLADSEHLLRNITSASPTALWMSNAAGEVNYVNQTWIDWSGKSFQDNLGQGWITAIHPDDRKTLIERLNNSIAKQTLYEAEFRMQQENGAPRWCVALAQPQYNKHQVFTGLIGSCTDITEHKELQAQKDNFIGIASHELKTPVTSLKGYTQVLERVLIKKGHELEAGMMKKMDTQLNRLTNLIRDLLDVTKINSGKLVLNEQRFELQLMIKDVVEDLQHSTQKHNLIENLNCSGKVFADKDRIEQVIINMITNAIKYSPTSEQIIIHCSQYEGDIIFCVEDFGVGIAEENQQKVFEQFFRVSGEMQHTFPGMGLGLYISSEIIQRAGGRIWVESTEGLGSRFYFSLPLQD